MWATSTSSRNLRRRCWPPGGARWNPAGRMRCSTIRSPPAWRASVASGSRGSGRTGHGSSPSEPSCSTRSCARRSPRGSTRSSTSEPGWTPGRTGWISPRLFAGSRSTCRASSRASRPTCATKCRRVRSSGSVSIWPTATPAGNSSTGSGRPPRGPSSSTEGVIGALSVDEAGGLADDLRAQPGCESWVIDYFSPRLLAAYQKHQPYRHVPVRFDPPSWEALFTDHGWRIREIRYLGEESRRLHRPVPLPALDRVLRLFTSRPLRDMGCAVLERVP
jgi:hypothetical protein